MGFVRSMLSRGSLALAAVLALALVAGGSWFVVTQAVDAALRENAKLTAAEWAAYLANALPDLELILEGQPLDSEAQRFLEKAQSVGNVFRYKLFDSSGTLRLDSANLESLPSNGHSLEEHNATAAEVVRTGEPFLESEEGDGVERPLHYAEAYYPLVGNDRRFGTIEVYVDQTERTRQLEQQFFWSALGVVALASAGFLLPMLAFIRRSRQKAAADAALSYAARHDALTGLLNRAEFRKVIERRIGREPDRRFHIHFIDLDKFKDVNDTRGHAIGDELLRQVAQRVQQTAGPDARACRLGGDEFALVEQDTDTLKDAADLATKIIAALSKPYRIRDAEVLIGASVGIAEYPTNGTSTTTLLRAADLALYEAKRRGRGGFCVFEPALEEERTRRLLHEKRLRRAADVGDFELYYQPLHNISQKTLMGFEALLRLRDDAGEQIPPSECIPIAEDTGLIVPLGAQILRRACEAAATWPEHLSVAVNLSPVQFEEGGLVQTVRDALDASGLDPHRLELELTETILMSDPDFVALQLDELKALGVSLALDDFGTGYSSLGYLWRFPFDKLKIDKSFVSSLGEDEERSLQVLKTVVALGEVLGLGVTAEGVETASQAAEVDRLNIDFVQGFYYGRPVEAEVVVANFGAGRDEAGRPLPIPRSSPAKGDVGA